MKTTRHETPVDVLVVSPLPSVEIGVGDKVVVPVLDPAEHLSVGTSSSDELGARLNGDGEIEVFAERRGKTRVPVTYWVHGVEVKRSIEITAREKRRVVRIESGLSTETRLIDLERVGSAIGMTRVTCEEVRGETVDDGISMTEQAEGWSVRAQNSGSAMVSAVLSGRSKSKPNKPLLTAVDLELTFRAASSGPGAENE